ncbi:hypothetical protein [Synoicihabitans lomoniglobus]|uniref:Prepilin-type N-terminal cleavage/methylation domain-containing protein n=1 Tax=Synoicihabitans lomoniglobus TaxID=2909285 RepID=A0AAE9ZZJ5_9BACT|nr:hypothetical protein [Opitutaceae bacterium LMO-M01]WED64303.1 hypothetical protein PXH66_18350 [Opitutaceae bacterium LMO-M01]
MKYSNHNRSKKTSGFTMAEIAVSATVMLFVITGMLGAVTSGVQMLDSSKRTIVASNLITHHVNDLRLAGWDTVSTLPANRTLTLPARFSSVADGMTLQRTVVEEDTDLYRVTFTVTWNGITGRAYSRSDDALFAKNGLSASYGY